MTKLPAKVKRTGVRQLTVSLRDGDCRTLERLRLTRGLRSWGEVVRRLIRDESLKAQRAGKG